MTTIVNNPGSGEGVGTGLVAGIIIAIAAIALLLFVFGLPALRGEQFPKDTSIDVNVKLPGGSTVPAASPKQ